MNSTFQQKFNKLSSDLLSVPSPFNNTCISSRTVSSITPRHEASSPRRCACFKGPAKLPFAGMLHQTLMRQICCDVRSHPFRFARNSPKRLGQAWVDGFSPVFDWRFPDSPPLPLWIITFWIKTGIAIEAQRKWKASELWLRSLFKKVPGRESLVERVEETFSLFHSISWGVTMTSTQTPMNRPRLNYDSLVEQHPWPNN